MNSSPVVPNWSVCAHPRIFGRWARTCAPPWPWGVTSDHSSKAVSHTSRANLLRKLLLLSDLPSVKFLIVLRRCRLHFFRRSPLLPSSLKTAATGRQSSSRNNSRGRNQGGGVNRPGIRDLHFRFVSQTCPRGKSDGILSFQTRRFFICCRIYASRWRWKGPGIQFGAQLGGKGGKVEAAGETKGDLRSFGVLDLPPPQPRSVPLLSPAPYVFRMGKLDTGGDNCRVWISHPRRFRYPMCATRVMTMSLHEPWQFLRPRYSMCVPRGQRQ